MTSTQSIPGADARDMAIIEKLGLKVTTNGGTYIVRDPQVPKSKYEGGNLYALAIRAEAVRVEHRTKPTNGVTHHTSGGMSISEAVEADKQVAKEKRNRQSARAAAAPTQQGRAEESSRAARATRAKRAPTDWKTYQVGMLILTNGDKTPEEILAMCKEAKIETKPGTVIGLTRYFRLCVRILDDIAKATKA